jgi:hypothetical protein
MGDVSSSYNFARSINYTTSTAIIQQMMRTSFWGLSRSTGEGVLERGRLAVMVEKKREGTL